MSKGTGVYIRICAHPKMEMGVLYHKTGRPQMDIKNRRMATSIEEQIIRAAKEYRRNNNVWIKGNKLKSSNKIKLYKSLMKSILPYNS